MLCTNLVVKQLYTDVQLLNSLFQKAYGEGIIPYVPLLKILNVPERTGCPWFHAVAMFLHCSTGLLLHHFAKSVYLCTLFNTTSQKDSFRIHAMRIES